MKTSQYVIFVAAPINLNKTHPQCYRRGEKGIHVTCSKADVLEKVNSLKASGEVVKRVCTAFGYEVKF